MTEKIQAKVIDLLTGKDGRLSTRRGMAWVMAAFYIHLCYYSIHRYESAVPIAIITTASVILVLLGLTTWQTVSFNKEENKAHHDSTGDN